IFLLMVAVGIALMLAIRFCLVETVARDLSRIRPRALVASYRMLIGTPYFMLCGIILGASAGAIYTQATVLPFILMERVGLTATQFGLAMLMQTGGYFLGAVAVRQVIGRIETMHLIPVGLVFTGIGAVLLFLVLRIQPPGLLNVMGPIALGAFGIAFMTPALT